MQIKRLFFFSIVCLVVFTTSTAQNYLTAEQLDRRSSNQLEAAKQAVNQRNYDQATRELDALLKRTPQAIDALILRAGIAYESRQYSSAEADYEAAYTLSSTYESALLYRLARTEIKLQKYGEAVTHLEAYLAQPDLNARQKERGEIYLNKARTAKALYEHPIPFAPQSLGDSINTVRGKEYLPSFTADGKYLIYTVNRDGQEDFYSSYRLDNGEWSKGQPLSEVNTPFDEGAQCISADGRTLFFTACGRKEGLGSCDLYWVTQKNGRWQKVQHPGEPFNSRHWDSQPSLSANGKYLLFASDRPGGFGGNDLYMSLRQQDGSWGVPFNMGPTINTAGNEESPFIHPDTRTLYFMSDGHPGLGDYDLFLTRVVNGAWTTPKNLGYPINTPAAEGALVVSLDGKTAYYTTDENTPPGVRWVDFDIYTFDLYPAIQPGPVTYVEVEVLDAQTKRPLSGVAAGLFAETSSQEWQFTTDANGKLLAVLPSGTDYQLELEMSGYLFHSERFELGDSTKLTAPFVLQVNLEQIAASSTDSKRQPIILKNVRFATGSAELLSSSDNELARLQKLLQEYPNLKIRINGHTDNVGSTEDNQQLSEQRARAVYDHLIAAGISADRLTYRGFGESQPIAENDTPEGRSQNRRTEFEVVD